MAIAVSRPVAPPPRDAGTGSRMVAMSWDDAGALDPAGSPGLDRLVSVARRLAARAPWWPGMTRPAYRRWDLIAVTDNFEAWVIAWPPGGAIELHDHGGSAGAVVVAAGALRETRVASQASGSWALEASTIGVGETTCFAGHDVHDIVNLADAPAISVHVYAPRLTTMTYYWMTEGVLESESTVHYRFGEAVA